MYVLAEIPKELYSLADKIQIRGEVLQRPELTPRDAEEREADKSGKSSKVTHQKGLGNANHTLSILINQK